MKRRMQRHDTQNKEETPIIKMIEKLHEKHAIESSVAVVSTVDGHVFTVTDGEIINLVGLLEYGKQGLLDTSEWQEDEEYEE